MKALLNNLLVFFKKWRFVCFWLLVLVLFGYTLWRIQAISNPKPDQAYINSQQSQQATKINIPDSLRAQLENSINTKVNVAPGSLGHHDPFNP